MFVNVGPSERKLRIIVGLMLMAMGFAAPVPDQWHMVLTTLGVAVLVPSALGFCPFKALVLRRLT